MTQKLVWLDCDPGHDDAFAIMLAGHHSAISLLGISTAAGNQTIEKTTTNALKVLELSGLHHIDVVPGQAVPLLRPPMTCPEIHGNTGLDCNTFIPPPSKKPLQAKKAIFHMFEVINSAPSPVTIIATACLTNVALVLIIFPEIKPKIQEIVLLGGAIGIGNMAPAAEFNILVDPEAAKIVFESGVRVVMVPLEVSHTALVTQDIRDRIAAMGTRFAAIMVDWLLFFRKTYEEVFRFVDPPLHDPLAVAYVIAPHLFTVTHMRVDIETSSPLCAGRTVCDIFNMSANPKNAIVATKVNVEAFWDLLLDALKKANAVSYLNVPSLPA